MGYPCQELLAPKPWDLRWATPVKGREEPGTETFCGETFRPANQICVWEHWGLTLLGQILGGGPLGARFGHFAAFQLANEICFWKPSEEARRAKSYQGAFWSQIWTIWACQLAIEICFWKPWEKAFWAKS